MIIQKENYKKEMDNESYSSGKGQNVKHISEKSRTDQMRCGTNGCDTYNVGDFIEELEFDDDVAPFIPNQVMSHIT